MTGVQAQVAGVSGELSTATARLPFVNPRDERNEKPNTRQMNWPSCGESTDCCLAAM